jgi:hypothetical protein
MKPKFTADGRCTCGHPPQPDIHAPGYGVRKDGTTFCIDCLTDRQLDTLKIDGEGKLFLDESDEQHYVTNEARTMRFPVIFSRLNDHNVAQHRRDAWFVGPDGMRWQGASFGPGPMKVRRCTGIHALREQVRALGMSLYLTDGEYRLNYRHGREETAYRTTDPVDVYRAAERMAAERDAPKPIVMEW